jgi:hypothetical protein
MKNKFFKTYIAFAFLILFSSCKKDNNQINEIPEPVEDKSFRVTMNLVVQKDDNFQIYYNEDGSDIYTPDKYIDVPVKGNTQAQDIIFKLPEDALPTSLRFDLGSNKEQGAVKINDFRMKYFDKTFVAKDTLFIYYFGHNQQVEYDRGKAIAKPKIISNETYDPIFTGTELLKEEIKKMVK